jgi:hypothetical protein
LQVDLDVITNLGRTASNEEFNAVITDLASADHIERSIRRGLMRIRISPAKLQLIRADVDNLIEVPRSPTCWRGRRWRWIRCPVRPRRRCALRAPVRVGFAKRTGTSATGRPISEVLQQAKVTEEELIAEAKEAGSRSPRDEVASSVPDRPAAPAYRSIRSTKNFVACWPRRLHELLELRQRTSGSS